MEEHDTPTPVNQHNVLWISPLTDTVSQGRYVRGDMTESTLTPGLAVPLCATYDPVHSPVFLGFLAPETFLGDCKVVAVASECGPTLSNA